MSAPFRSTNSRLAAFACALLYVIAPLTISAELDPVRYGDCSYVDLGEVDDTHMTREEKAQALEMELFSSLDKSEACMSAAAAQGAEEVADAAGGAGNTAGTLDGTDADDSTSDSSQQASETAEVQSGSPENSKDSDRGQASKGSSAVCDAVATGLANATTEAEKEHFQQLKNEYGC
ncbi:MAG: hypothetical protein ACQEQ8_11075 [Pseudomonadota bacterium]